MKNFLLKNSIFFQKQKKLLKFFFYFLFEKKVHKFFCSQNKKNKNKKQKGKAERKGKFVVSWVSKESQ